METKTQKSLLEEIRETESAIQDLKQKLLTLKANVAVNPQLVSDYTFTDGQNQKIRLSELFGDKNELLVVHNMGKSCPYCTSWADEINGIIHHIENRTPFVLISPDEPEIMKEFSASRNWKFKILSAKGNSFKKDIGFEDKGKATPGVSCFIKDAEGKIYHRDNAVFGPGDNFCSLWYYFSLLPGGAGNWHPKYSY